MRPCWGTSQTWTGLRAGQAEGLAFATLQCAATPRAPKPPLQRIPPPQPRHPLPTAPGRTLHVVGIQRLAALVVGGVDALRILRGLERVCGREGIGRAAAPGGGLVISAGAAHELQERCACRGQMTGSDSSTLLSPTPLRPCAHPGPPRSGCCAAWSPPLPPPPWPAWRCSAGTAASRCTGSRWTRSWWRWRARSRWPCRPGLVGRAQQ